MVWEEVIVSWRTKGMEQKGAGFLLEQRGCLDRVSKSGEEEGLGNLRRMKTRDLGV